MTERVRHRARSFLGPRDLRWEVHPKNPRQIVYVAIVNLRVFSTQAPLTFPGILSTAGHCDQSSAICLTQYFLSSSNPAVAHTPSGKLQAMINASDCFATPRLVPPGVMRSYLTSSRPPPLMMIVYFPAMALRFLTPAEGYASATNWMVSSSIPS